jgi:hypothetical protein
MIFSDPFRRGDEPGDQPLRGRARLVCNLVAGAIAAAFFIGDRIAPVQCEPFTVVGIAVMLVAMVLSYVF